MWVPGLQPRAAPVLNKLLEVRGSLGEGAGALDRPEWGARAEPEHHQVPMVQPAVGTEQGHRKLARVYLQKKKELAAHR
jgi:hypothetical protein